MRRRTMVLLAIGIMASAIGLLTEVPARPSATPNASAAASASSETGEAVLALGYLAGTAVGTELRYRTEFGSGYQQSEGGGFALSGRGELIWTVVAREPGYTRLRGELQGLELSATGQGDHVGGRDPAAIERAGRRPFYADVQSDGSIEGILIERDSISWLTTIRRTLAAAFQVVEPGEPRAAWRTRERDHTGELVAHYQRRGAREFDKTKERYERIRQSADLVPAAGRIEASASARVSLQEQGAIRDYAARERVSLHLMQTPIVSEARLTLHLERCAQAPVPVVSLDDYVFVPLFGRPDSETVAKAAPTTRSLPSLLTTLRDARASEGMPWELVAELAALLANDPNAVREVVGLLASNELDEVTQQRLLTALAEAGSAESQMGLLDVASGRGREAIRDTAITHVTLLENPTAATITRLRDMMDDVGGDAHIARAAALAYGASARHGAASQDEATRAAAREASADLVNALAAARSEDERNLMVSALGNSAAAEALAPLSALARTQRPADRAAALGAMRLIEGPEVDTLLQEALLLDDHEQVRREALGSLDYRSFSSQLERTLEQALGKEPSGSVRKDILTMLMKNAAVSERATEIVQQSAERDSSEDVRAYAAELLKRGTES